MFSAQTTQVSSSSKLYVDDVFSAYTRTGTGADQTVTTNIDMTQGYLVWSKSRSAATDHALYDSVRGVTYDLVSNSTAAQTVQSIGLKSVSSTGHTWGTLAKINTSTATYIDWVFRKAAKFLDIVTYTGDGSGSVRNITHSLGVTPGMIIVKRTDSTSSWWVWHTALPTQNGTLDTTNAFSGALRAINGATATTFGIDNNQATINVSGSTYIAYVFAHDASADWLIQCGSFITDSSGNATVNLGGEIQFLLDKQTTGTTPWEMQDAMRVRRLGNDLTPYGFLCLELGYLCFGL